MSCFCCSLSESKDCRSPSWAKSRSDVSSALIHVPSFTPIFSIFICNRPPVPSAKRHAEFSSPSKLILHPARIGIESHSLRWELQLLSISVVNLSIDYSDNLKTVHGFNQLLSSSHFTTNVQMLLGIVSGMC